MSRYLLFILIAITVISCKNPLQKNSVVVGQEGWSDSVSYYFKYNNIDTLTYKDLIIHIVADNKLNFNHIDVELRIDSPDSLFYIDTMRLVLDKSNKLAIKSQFKSDEVMIKDMMMKYGLYNFSIRQLSAETMRYIREIDIVVSNTD